VTSLATPLRVIGVGSPFGADRIGWELVTALREEGQLEAEFVESDRPGAGLLAAMLGAEWVVLVDAMRAGLPVGTVCPLEPEQVEGESGLLSSHGFGVAHALDLGQALGMLPPRVTVIGVEIGPPPSPQLSPALFAQALLALQAAISAESPSPQTSRMQCPPRR